MTDPLDPAVVDTPPKPERFVVFDSVAIGTGVTTWVLRDRQAGMDYPFGSALNAENAAHHPLLDSMKGSPSSFDTYHYADARVRNYFS